MEPTVRSHRSARYILPRQHRESHSSTHTSSPSRSNTTRRPSSSNDDEDSPPSSDKSAANEGTSVTPTPSPSADQLPPADVSPVTAVPRPVAPLGLAESANASVSQVPSDDNGFTFTTAQLIAISIGSAAILIVLFALLVWCWCRKRSKNARDMRDWAEVSPSCKMSEKSERPFQVLSDQGVEESNFSPLPLLSRSAPASMAPSSTRRRPTDASARSNNPFLPRLLVDSTAARSTESTNPFADSYTSSSTQNAPPPETPVVEIGRALSFSENAIRAAQPSTPQTPRGMSTSLNRGDGSNSSTPRSRKSAAPITSTAAYSSAPRVVSGIVKHASRKQDKRASKVKVIKPPARSTSANAASPTTSMPSTPVSFRTHSPTGLDGDDSNSTCQDDPYFNNSPMTASPYPPGKLHPQVTPGNPKRPNIQPLRLNHSYSSPYEARSGENELNVPASQHRSCSAGHVPQQQDYGQSNRENFPGENRSRLAAPVSPSQIPKQTETSYPDTHHFERSDTMGSYEATRENSGRNEDTSRYTQTQGALDDYYDLGPDDRAESQAAELLHQRESHINSKDHYLSGVSDATSAHPNFNSIYGSYGMS